MRAEAERPDQGGEGQRDQDEQEKRSAGGHQEHQEERGLSPCGPAFSNNGELVFEPDAGEQQHRQGQDRAHGAERLGGVEPGEQR